MAAGQSQATEENDGSKTVEQTELENTFDPLQLETIELTAYVLGLIRKEITTEQLIQSLGRNYSLTGAYLRMFDQLNWIENKGGKWKLTELGALSLPRFQSKQQNQTDQNE